MSWSLARSLAGNIVPLSKLRYALDGAPPSCACLSWSCSHRVILTFLRKLNRYQLGGPTPCALVTHLRSNISRWLRTPTLLLRPYLGLAEATAAFTASFLTDRLSLCGSETVPRNRSDIVIDKAFNIYQVVGLEVLRLLANSVEQCFNGDEKEN